ncbi:hypothetical protein LTR22_002778 [Elasticomyces elasticus]|nr:hypothetical protein LTR22_002778 [Elasticomyces elasticus]KAK4931293.1 hypothetical protein LTR49_002351 [Elasticomyces elasticus]
MRLVCKDTAAAVYETYVSTCFRVRTHLVTTRGMEMLADVTAHNEYVKHIKKIVLVAPGLEPSKFDDNTSSYHQEPNESDEHYSLRCSKRNAWYKLEDERDCMTTSGSFVALLMQTMSNLHASGISPHVCIRDTEPRSSALCGRADLRDMLGTCVEPGDLSYGCIDDLMSKTFTAIAASPAKVEALSISALHECAASDFHPPPGMFGSPKAPFHYLKSLKLGFGDLSYGGWDEEDFENLGVTMRSAQGLQHITLSCAAWNNGVTLKTVCDFDYFQGFIHHLSHTSLKSIRLESMIVTAVGDITDFLAPIAAQLQRVHLIDIVIPPHDCYGDLFRWMLINTTALSEVKLKDLADEHPLWLVHEKKKLDWFLKDAEGSDGEELFPIDEDELTSSGDTQVYVGDLRARLATLADDPEYDSLDDPSDDETTDEEDEDEQYTLGEQQYAMLVGDVEYDQFDDTLDSESASEENESDDGSIGDECWEGHECWRGDEDERYSKGGVYDDSDEELPILTIPSNKKKLSLRAAKSMRSTSAAMMPPLLTMPTEMLAVIAEQSDPQDVLALRLTRRCIANAVEDAFIKTFFVKRRHLYSVFGLQSLLRITATPHLVQHIQEIEITVVQPPMDHTRTKYRFSLPGKTEATSTWFEEYSQLNKANIGGSLLLGIFKNLKLANVVPKVVTSWRADKHQSPACYGLQTMLRGFIPQFGAQITMEQLEEGYADTLATRLVQAICCSGAPIRTLTLGSRSNKTGIGSKGFSVDTHHQHPHKLATLEALHIDVADLIGGWNAESYAPAMKLFGSTTALERLSIKWQRVYTSRLAGLFEFEDGEGSADSLKWFGPVFAPATGLRNFELAGAEGSVDSFIAILARFKCLQVVKLNNSRIYEGECWSKLFSWMAEAKETQWQKVSLSHLYRVDAALLVQDGESHVPLAHEWKGVEAVRTAIKGLVEGPQYSEPYRYGGEYSGDQSDSAELSDYDDVDFDSYDEYDEKDDEDVEI